MLQWLGGPAGLLVRVLLLATLLGLLGWCGAGCQLTSLSCTFCRLLLLTMPAATPLLLVRLCSIFRRQRMFLLARRLPQLPHC